MTNQINLGIQVWFICAQKKIFILHVIEKISKTGSFLLKFYPSSLSKVIKNLTEKNLYRENTNLIFRELKRCELFLIRIIHNHFLFLIGILKLNMNKRIILIRKILIKNFCDNVYNQLREKIIYRWLESFSSSKILDFRFNSLVEQASTSYLLNFLSPFIIIIYIWTIISKRKSIVLLKDEKFYFKEIQQFSTCLSEVFLVMSGHLKIKKFLLSLKKFINKKKKFLKKKIFKKFLKFFFFIDIKILIQIKNKKILNKNSENCFTNYISSLDCSFNKRMSEFIFIKPFFLLLNVVNLFEVLRRLFENYLENFIYISSEAIDQDLFYIITYFSLINNYIYKIGFLKYKNSFNLCENFNENLNVYFCKFFSFFKFLSNFKYKENVFFLSLLSENTKNRMILVNENNISLYIQKYLYSSYDLLSFKTDFNLISSNIRFYIGIYSFFRLIIDLKLCSILYDIFYLTILAILKCYIFHKKTTVIEEIFFLLSKILILRSKNNFLNETKKDSIEFCKNICIHLSISKDNLIRQRYKNKVFRIYEELNGYLTCYSRYRFWNFTKPSNLWLKNSHLITKNVEFIRDIYSYFNLETGIKTIDFKILDRTKKEFQYLPIKIFRILRAYSRHYFVENLRKKLIIWNFEIIRILIQGSVIYCSKYTIYFVQLKYNEVIFILSFNRCSFIFYSEFNFLSEIFTTKQIKTDKVIENIFYNIKNKVFLLIEKFYSLGTDVILNYHLIKNNIPANSTESNITMDKLEKLSYDHIYVTEAIVMKMLKMKLKLKSNHFLYSIEKKLSHFFLVDPRGILIQTKNLNEKEYVNYYNNKNFYAYL